MKKINLLDCTLRDGGYINDWNFGYDSILGIIEKLEQTGIEMIEVGFLKGDTYNKEKSLFPDIETFTNVIKSKKKNILYVGMADMTNPVPIEKISKYDGSSIDGIRVIFKKDKIEPAYKYCKKIKELGYKLFVNFVGTDQYSDKEFIEGLDKFSSLNPEGVTIVDTFGTIKRKDFKRLVSIADNNLSADIMLCYHAHNNLQQAFSNAEAFIDMNLNRDIVIDACVFGMGRGAGNLNLELFADYMNENYGTNYRIAPILEIMDEYLAPFYRTKFWGYSLPLYLSASHKCHPNYAIYLAEKNTLSEKAFNELLLSIPKEDKDVFSKEKAEKYYKLFLENYVNDKEIIEKLKYKFKNKNVLLVAPGKSVRENTELINQTAQKQNLITMTINFYDNNIKSDYVFCSNIKRYKKLTPDENYIITSNIKDSDSKCNIINFASYVSSKEYIYDNSGLMALNLLYKIGVKKIFIAGMDGFSDNKEANYYNTNMINDVLVDNNLKNKLISEELINLKSFLNIEFITPTKYKI